MEYHKINLLSNTPNQPSKFKTKYWVELNYDSHGTYNTNSKAKFKTSILKSSVCDYGYTYIHVQGNLIVQNTETVAAPNNSNIKAIFIVFSPPPSKFRGGFLVFEIWTTRGVMKKLLRNRG